MILGVTLKSNSSEQFRVGYLCLELGGWQFVSRSSFSNFSLWLLTLVPLLRAIFDVLSLLRNPENGRCDVQ